jgi:hypothetical protein
MFFELMSREEKKNCLALLSGLAKVDGHVHERENELIAGYSFMMGLNVEEIVEQPVQKLIEYFSSKSEIIRKAVYLESFGLVLSDSFFHPLEQSVMKDMRNAFGFAPEFSNQCAAWIQKLLPTYYEGFSLVGIKPN